MTLPENDSADLLERARRLEVDALGQIHDRYYASVFRYVRYRLDDVEVCKNVTSEVFLAFVEALRKRRGPAKDVRGWLMVTASQRIDEMLRRQPKPKPATPVKDERRISLVGGASEAAASDAWQAEDLRAALNRLPAGQQQVLALRFAGELSVYDIAEIIGKKATVVKTMQFNALGALRRFLEEKPA